MPDFRLHPSARTPGSGRDFRLYPGWTGAVAGLLVAGTAVAPGGIASSTVAVGNTISVGGTAVAAGGIVLGAVELHRMIIATARAPWTGLVTASKVCIVPWPGLQPLPVVQRARSAALASLPLMLRIVWPGLPSLQNVKRALWSGIQPTPSTLHRAAWPGLPSLQDVQRARWGGILTLPSSRVIAKWNDLLTPTRLLRSENLGFGEGAGNAYKRLQQLLPTDPLMVGTVIAVWADGTSTIELPGGGEWRVKGDSIALGARVYVQGGMIQGEAPALAGANVEV